MEGKEKERNNSKKRKKGQKEKKDKKKEKKKTEGKKESFEPRRSTRIPKMIAFPNFFKFGFIPNNGDISISQTFKFIHFNLCIKYFKLK